MWRLSENGKMGGKMENYITYLHRVQSAEAYRPDVFDPTENHIPTST